MVVQQQDAGIGIAFQVGGRRRNTGKTAPHHDQVEGLAGVARPARLLVEFTVPDGMGGVDHFVGVAVLPCVIAHAAGPGPVCREAGQGYGHLLGDAAVFYGGVVARPRRRRVHGEQACACPHQGIADKITPGDITLQPKQCFFSVCHLNAMPHLLCGIYRDS